jgi:hypothetical protein
MTFAWAGVWLGDDIAEDSPTLLRFWLGFSTHEFLDWEFSTRLMSVDCCPASTKIGMCRHVLVELSNIKFNENPPSGSREFACRRTHMAKRMGAFLELLFE